MNRRRSSNRVFCEAVTQKQYEAATWGASKIGCGNVASTEVTEDGTSHPVCHVHADSLKRNGWNR